VRREREDANGTCTRLVGGGKNLNIPLARH